jgi:dihydroorotate dehydrogenase (NAD+) catalytic subunit
VKSLLRTPLLEGIILENPLMPASGTYGAALEGMQFGDIGRLGAIVTKTVTPKPRKGNPPPRLAETPCGMLNSIGLENPGLDRFLSEALPKALELGPPVILNIGGESLEEFEWSVERVQNSGVVALEINLSCPNVQGGALPFATDPEACHAIAASLCSRSDLPLFFKLSPNTHLLTEVAQAAVAGGAQGLTLINTLLGMAVDWRRGSPKIARGIAGLSGPAIKPVALRCIYQVRQVVEVPIFGVGGICDAEDVCEFLAAGATAVQVGTQHFRDPLAAVHLVQDLEDLCQKEGVSVEDLQNRLGRDRQD